MTDTRRAIRRRAAREAQQAGLSPRQIDIAMELALSLPGKVRAADLPAWSRPVVDTLRGVIRNSGTLAPCEQVLRGHPGVPSTLKIEWMFLGMLAANWAGFTFLRREILLKLSRLPDPVFAELAPVNGEGNYYTPGLSVFNNQQRRLEAALRDGRLDLDWIEHAWIKASIPEHIALLILLVAIDTTAFPGWHLTQRYEHEADVRRDVRKRYREIHGEDRPIPEFDTPEMRAFAEQEFHIIFGEDGRMERCHADPDFRGGYKTPTAKRPQKRYGGFASHIGATAAFPTDDDDDDAHVPTYITAVKTTAANADAGPIGDILGERTHDIAIQPLHLVQDMDFSRKPHTYTIPRRQAGDQIHANFPAPATRTADKPIIITRRDGTEATLVVSCGTPFHEHTPKDLLALPAELFMKGREEELNTRLNLRHSWSWDTIEYDQKTGNTRMRCPHCAGKIFDVTGRLPPSPRQRDNALPVEFPNHVTECCPGTITVTIEDLPTLQKPAYGTPAHTKIMNQRNAVESPFGTAKDKGGLEPGTCKAARLEAHALAALTTFVVMNLQTTMDQEIKEVQELLKRHRQQQAVHTQDTDTPPVDEAELVDADEVEPADGHGLDEAELVEADEVEPADGHGLDEAELVEADEVEPADGHGLDEAEPVEADEVEPADGHEPDGAEPVEADEAEPADDAQADEERIADPQELPQAVTLRPNDRGRSAAAVHKRARPPP